MKIEMATVAGALSSCSCSTLGDGSRREGSMWTRIAPKVEISIDSNAYRCLIVDSRLLHPHVERHVRNVIYNMTG